MKKTLPRPTYVGPILETSQAQAITHVPSTRTRIIVSRYVLVMSLIGGLILFGYAGAEIGFLIGGLALVLIGYAVFEMFLRMGQSNLYPRRCTGSHLHVRYRPVTERDRE
jgi:hypothetical protein